MQAVLHVPEMTETTKSKDNTHEEAHTTPTSTSQAEEEDEEDTPATAATVKFITEPEATPAAEIDTGETAEVEVEAEATTAPPAAPEA